MSMNTFRDSFKRNIKLSIHDKVSGDKDTLTISPSALRIIYATIEEYAHKRIHNPQVGKEVKEVWWALEGVYMSTLEDDK